MGEVTSIQMARRQAVNDRAETEMEKLLGQARFKLIETGTRNRLIHTPRGNRRSRALPIMGNVSDQVFANFVPENKPLHNTARSGTSEGTAPGDAKDKLPERFANIALARAFA